MLNSHTKKPGKISAEAAGTSQLVEVEGNQQVKSKQTECAIIVRWLRAVTGIGENRPMERERLTERCMNNLGRR